MQGIYGFDNSYMLDTAERYPGVFGIVATIDHVNRNPKERMDELKERGVQGFRIVASPGKAQNWLDDNGYETMFRTAADNNQAICPLTHPEGLPDLDRMCGKHPETTVVVDHMARIGELGPIEEEKINQLCKLARHPNVHVKISRLHSLGDKKPPHQELIPMIKRVIDAFGPDRIMWGSDSPYQVVTESYSDSINLIRDHLDLSASERQSILNDTAARLFFA